MLEGRFHVAHKAFRLHNARNLDGCGQHRRVREVPAKGLFGDAARVDGAHLAGIAAQQRTDFARGFFGVDDDRALFCEACGHVHRFEQGLIDDNHEIGVINV